MSENEVQKGLTVKQTQAVKKALEKGGTPEDAAHAAGITLTQLRQQGKLAATIKALLDRADLDDKTRRQVGKARLTELALQDDDLKVALGAAKVISGEGVPGVALQINQNLVTDPDVLDSLKSLQIDVEGEKRDS
jgi:hypothetical protein